MSNIPSARGAAEANQAVMALGGTPIEWGISLTPPWGAVHFELRPLTPEQLVQIDFYLESPVAEIREVAERQLPRFGIYQWTYAVMPQFPSWLGTEVYVLPESLIRIYLTWFRSREEAQAHLAYLMNCPTPKVIPYAQVSDRTRHRR